ncbi:MAG: histidine phosphatase family protein [Gammaproteobacteria bacterium]|nr:histidine phosphatase family protein [Gammaproteobacteria bacterium]
MHQSLTLDLWRHGPVSVPGRLYGATDVAPCELGVAALAEAIVARRPSGILCSPLARALLPAQQAAMSLKVPLQISPALSEWHFGQWEGVRLDDPAMAEPLAALWQTPHLLAPPGGESLVQFRQRIRNWLATLEVGTQQHWAVVCHAGVIRALIGEVLQQPDRRFHQLLRLSIAYGSRTTLSIGHWQQQPVLQLEQINHL